MQFLSKVALNWIYTSSDVACLHVRNNSKLLRHVLIWITLPQMFSQAIVAYLVLSVNFSMNFIITYMDSIFDKTLYNYTYVAIVTNLFN